MKKINIFVLVLFVLVFVSCDFNELPTDKLEKGRFFKTANASALEQYCNWFYPKLITGHGAPQDYTMGGMLNLDADADQMLTWEKNDVAFGHHVAPTDKKNTPWDWEVIRACNDFIQNYKLSPESEAIKNRYLGEVLFFKSMDYFNKVKTYGDVPWYETVLEPGSEELYKRRDSRVLVMDNVLRDINLAIKYLPKKTLVSRVSKDAAIALKARICLFEGTFRRYHDIEGDLKFLEEAYNAAGELMKPEYGYSLFTGSKPSKSYYELFIQADYNNNPEVILSKEYEPSIGKGNNVSRQMAAGETPIGMSRDCIENYLSIDGKPYASSPLHSMGEGLIKELKDRDPRLLQTVATPEPGEFTYYLNGNRPAIQKIVGEKDNKGSCATGYAIVKYFNPEEVASDHHIGTVDAPVFRYAEILLIRAEAGAELGKDPELDKTVNALRARVGFNVKLTASPESDPRMVEQYPSIKGANANLIREIRRERGVEMFGEGVRRDDLMRWAAGALLAKKRYGIIIDQTLYTPEEVDALKKAFNVTDITKPIDIYSSRVATPPMFVEPKNYLFAIPINEIALNPALAPNNPGWE
ncbi:MAG: RagB/SusD family nutrient uptake outer membrane protein [Proteiniphilum sp.]|nr:RagB/SusD family nutrient uptake outer membrane protein [Proteiniphilum sp.]MDD3908639.1 RagB/SusD family nutrient uptake outer membrane protein [Proteiniphilum sp.]MDD4415391.1 RagB/SusD family nutrient uptake outer membrane protein [Proteiniphilum sp.]